MTAKAWEAGGLTSIGFFSAVALCASNFGTLGLMGDLSAIDEGAAPSPSSLNIVRGLTRLFVVFALCWYIGSGVYVWPRWSNYFYELAEADKKPVVDPLLANFGLHQDQDDKNMAVLRRYLATLHRPTELTAWLILIPVGVYSLGVGIFWIVRGFRSSLPVIRTSQPLTNGKAMLLPPSSGL